MDLGGFCRFADRENVRLRCRARIDVAGTRYRIVLNVELARHICHEWSDVFPIDRPLAAALDFIAGKYAPFYSDLIARQRHADLVLLRSATM